MRGVGGVRDDLGSWLQPQAAVTLGAGDNGERNTFGAAKKMQWV